MPTKPIQRPSPFSEARPCLDFSSYEKLLLARSTYEALARVSGSQLTSKQAAGSPGPPRPHRRPPSLQLGMDIAKAISGGATTCVLGGLSAAISYALAVSSVMAFYGGCAGIILTLPSARRAAPYTAGAAVILNAALRLLRQQPIDGKDVIGAAFWGAVTPSAVGAWAGGAFCFCFTYWPVVIGVSTHAACSGAYGVLCSAGDLGYARSSQPLGALSDVSMHQ